MLVGAPDILGVVPETHFDAWMARHFETLWPELFDPAVLDPTVSFLADLAGAGPALELGIGTGRVAWPLARRGIPVHGIELSAAMAAEVEAHAEVGDVSVTVGDFATTEVGRDFTLAYLVRNTITNLTTQDEQVDCFRNVAAQLTPGGCFVIENYIPALQRLPPGETTYLFAATPMHVAYEEYDVAAQVAVSHHHWVVDGEIKTLASPHRYLWPSELDLMARLAGMTLRERWADWHRTPFTGESRSHVSVWQKA